MDVGIPRISEGRGIEYPYSEVPGLGLDCFDTLRIIRVEPRHGRIGIAQCPILGCDRLDTGDIFRLALRRGWTFVRLGDQREHCESHGKPTSYRANCSCIAHVNTHKLPGTWRPR